MTRLEKDNEAGKTNKQIMAPIKYDPHHEVTSKSWKFDKNQLTNERVFVVARCGQTYKKDHNSGRKDLIMIQMKHDPHHVVTTIA